MNFLSKLFSSQIARLNKENQLLRLENKILKEQTEKDILTGLKNRRFLEENLRHFLDSLSQDNRHNRQGEQKTTTASLLFVDIDHFKNVNDTQGHDAGDAVLNDVSKLLEKGVRSQDVVARWGGEEIVIFLPRANEENAAKKAESLREKIEEKTKDKIPVTISVGVAEYHAGDTLEGWLKRADDAMYEAKSTGRNRVKVA